VIYRRLVLISLFAATSVFAQQPKNVKILVGLSRPEVQRIMNQMRAGLGVHCHYCHVAGQDPSVDATPEKEKARDMMRMVVDLNQRYFGGRNVMTCFTCHNGSPHPQLSPPLPQPLPRDRTYQWQVETALGAKRSIAPAPEPARFRIIGDGELAELDRARAAGDPLVLAALYARAGLMDPAVAELRKLAGASDPRMRRLLASYEASPNSTNPAQ